MHVESSLAGSLLGIMKRHSKYEAVAVVSGIVGAFVLVIGLMPFINPGFIDVYETEYSPRAIFLAGTLFALLFLGVSWHFNMKAWMIRKETNVAETPQARKLKWIVCGIVILLILSAFLW
jgi:hypothetical protein